MLLLHSRLFLNKDFVSMFLTGEPEFPSTWTAVKSDFDMVSVEANSPEYDGIVKAFRQSAGGNAIEIQSVRENCDTCMFFVCSF